jgi:hypothetical protein
VFLPFPRGVTDPDDSGLGGGSAAGLLSPPTRWPIQYGDMATLAITAAKKNGAHALAAVQARSFSTCIAHAKKFTTHGVISL